MTKRRKTRKRAPSKALKKIGLAPGTLTYTGQKENGRSHIEVIDYSADFYQKHVFKKVSETFDIGAEDTVTWTNVNGLQDVEDIERLGKFYDLHPLILEDIVDTHQRPKLDEYDDYLFVVAKMLYFENEVLSIEHISMVVGKDYLITFQESHVDVFDPLRKRIEESKGRVRSTGTDYLMFAILDAILDNYFVVLERLGERIEDIEDELFLESADDSVRDVQELKRDALKIRRSIMPLREVINKLIKSEFKLIHKETMSYLRDLYDNNTQAVESVEIYREMIWGLMDMYMSTVSNKMNNVMKVLTIISTIFIPLSFIAGLYGMNFDNMPELHTADGYFYVLGVMMLISIGMLMYFKRKKWL